MKRLFFFGLILLAGTIPVRSQGKFNYTAQWKIIDKMMSDGLPKSALPELEKVYQAALKDKEYGQLIKAVMKRSDCLQTTEEDPQIAIIAALKHDAETIPFPGHAIIYSLIGETFMNYYTENRWRIYDRTTLAEPAENDAIETWDTPRLIGEAIRYYQLSLADTARLRQTSVADFKEALEGEAATRYLRPTLYDLLTHRAIDAYMRSDPGLTDFTQPFSIDRVEYFGDAQTFARLDFAHGDSLSVTYRVMKLFRELTAFRLTQNDINALTDVDLSRLEYVKNNGRYANADILYEDAMKHLINACTGQKIWGKAAYTLAFWYKTEGERWESGKDPKRRYRIAEAVELCRNIQKNAELKEDKECAKKLIEDATNIKAFLQSEKNNLPGKPILASISYKNTDAVYVNIYGYRPDDTETIEKYGSDQMQKVKQLLSKLPLKASHRIVLPTQSDYQTHRTEVKIDSLPLGTYLLTVTDKLNPVKDKPELFTYNFMQITGIKLLQRTSGKNRIEIYVTDASTGKPLNEATVEVIQREYDQQTSQYEEKQFLTINTDTCGTADISIPKGYNNRLRITCGNDVLTENIRNGYVTENDTSTRIVLFTDRAVYRPGQTIYFKGLTYKTVNDGDNRILTGRKVNVGFRDVNGKEIVRRDFVTNDYGSFNGTFIIPQGLLNGRMQIETADGSTSVQVEEYKRPTFEVKILPPTESFRLGDTVTLSGKAEALAGYVVDDATIKYNVVRRAEYRPFKRGYIFPPLPQQRQIASGKTQTDNTGQFAIAFKAEDGDIGNNDLIWIYELTVDVTDAAGETRNASREIRLGKNPLLLNVKIPENITADDTARLKYGFIAANFDGTPVPSDVRVEIYSLKGPEQILRKRLWEKPDTFVMTREEFKTDFPGDVYANDDDPTTYSREQQLASWNFDSRTASEIDLGVLKNASSGWYLIKMNATAGRYSIGDSLCVRFRRADAPILDMSDWVAAVKDSGEPGEQAVFRIASGTEESQLRYDVMFKGKVVERRQLTVGTVPVELRFPIAETYRGGFAVMFAMVQGNRTYSSLREIRVPYTNKELDIAFTTFRGQLLPGEKEKWTLTVKNKQGKREAAEMVAALYDASLDAFAPHDWLDGSFFYPSRWYRQYEWSNRNNWDILSYSRHLLVPSVSTPDCFSSYERLSWLEGGPPMGRAYKGKVQRSARYAEMAASPGFVTNQALAESVVTDDAVIVGSIDKDAGGGGSTREPDLNAIPLRENFSETAFFYPELRTDEKGEILIEFTVPEALTRWNMLGFAHTKDFKVGNITNSLVTQKKVAVTANLPRFFRQGDTLVLAAKINNLTEGDLKGDALLRLYDAFTGQTVDIRMLKTGGTQPFVVKAGQSAAVQWKLVVPETLQAVSYRLTAKAGNHTDGEERSVPVLSNRTLVTESMPFMVRADQRKDFRFDKLADNKSKTLQNKRVTLEYTSNPAWYAVQALPYLMEYPYECAEQTFARFYSNALAAVVANKSPRIKQIFNQWKSIPDSKALLSNLEKNQDLKQALLEETPWVLQANNETERKKRIGLLFDLNRTADERQKTLDKLKAIQGANGGFPWFAGQPEDRFVTQHIVAGLEHLRNLNALPRTEDINNLIERAMVYCDARIDEDYRNVSQKAGDRSKRDDRRIDRTQLHYLYMCSFSKHRPLGSQKAFEFYLQQTEKYWARFNIYEQAMAALVMYRFGKPDVAQNILRSLKERAQTSDDMGMYWSDNRRGYFWNDSPVETQALLIEAFNEAGSDTRAVGEMKIWLLRNKQTNDWKTTKATTEAIYALLATDDDLLGEASELLDIRLSGKPLKKMVKEPLRPEAGTGYVSTSWNGSDISTELAQLRVANSGNSIAWGAMYWQYFEDLDKITSAETNLQMSKQLFIKQTDNKGKVLVPVDHHRKLRVGDVVTVRMELRADRDFEYVHLKDMRAAGFEPITTSSGYRFRSGLGYYESIKDASVNFFISYLPKGTYVFEYDLRVSHAGDFSNGIPTFQCMYAPEFSAHGEGLRVQVRE